MKRTLIITGAALVVLAVAAMAYRAVTKPDWPEFVDAPDSSEPQVVVEVDNRDYAYHIGDLSVVRIFVRQKPNTTVHIPSIAFEGDFEIAGQPELTEKPLPDGSVVYRLTMPVQSFEVNPKLELKGAFSWEDGDNVREFEIPPTALYRSNTWDGRPDLQEGDGTTIPAWWYMARYIVPLSAALIVYSVLLIFAIRAWRKARLETSEVMEAAYRRVTEILALIKAGTSSAQLHLELDRVLREHWAVGPVPVARLDAKKLRGNQALVDFLTLNSPAVYSQNKLNEEENARLYSLGTKLLADW